ncbi:hypothetical protein L873DRAFT_1816929 [Choiromyces venosus 120613-1]|uniref:Uncharacterized protein n=1 Tax=Choiromyces venosus 120613-1 TaxID=1336337 RepID=A0A3N4J7D4_9PEZI|nr:hypothetical protein L873DRAFT_1816929 [Choiromyces venosus 120613-1]
MENKETDNTIPLSTGLNSSSYTTVAITSHLQHLPSLAVTCSIPNNVNSTGHAMHTF